MTDKINALKAEIFDILVRQDQLRMQNQHLDQLKQDKLKQLQDLLQSSDTEIDTEAGAEDATVELDNTEVD